jgi:hypothetical protein
MSLFSFGKRKTGIVTLIDIGSASVGGAYVRYQAGTQPLICYTARVDVAPRDGEDMADSMLRSLSFLEQLLAEEGAPELRRMFGDVVIERVVVSIAAPWQDMAVTTTQIEEQKPFVFTRGHVEKAVHKATLTEGHVLSGQTVISTILNGYQVAKPFGKRVSRAELVVLSSSVDRKAADSIRASLRRAFHSDDIEITAFAPAAYAAFRSLYPHQKDLVVIDVSGTATDVLFVKHGTLAQAASVPQGTHDLLRAALAAGKHAHLGGQDLLDQGANATFEKGAEAAESAWLQGLRDVFSRFAAERALPHAVFLLADHDAREYLKRTIEESAIRELWLTEEPLSVMMMDPAHLSGQVKMYGSSEQDLFLSILALASAPEPA